MVESFLDKVGAEVDARVDARLAAARTYAPPPPQQRGRASKPTQPTQPKPTLMALGSILLGIPVTAIAVPAGHTGLAGLLAIWIASAVINVAYALRLRPPRDRP